jgi:DNA invertase Pin-like site-specific DNA recombinase
VAIKPDNRGKGRADSLFPIENYSGRSDFDARPSATQEHKRLTSKTKAYLGVSTDKEDLDGQKTEIRAYGNKHNITVDEFIEVETASRKSTNKKHIDELVSKVEPGDTIIVADLSRIGRSIGEVINLVNGLVKKNVRLIAIKQGLNVRGKQDVQSRVIVTLFSLLAGVERNILSSRTKAGLAARKAEGIKLGRPKGALGTSKLDKHSDKIVEDLKARVSKAAIARKLHCSRLTVIKYVKSRGLA